MIEAVILYIVEAVYIGVLTFFVGVGVILLATFACVFWKYRKIVAREGKG